MSTMKPVHLAFTDRTLIEGERVELALVALAEEVAAIGAFLKENNA